MIDDILLFLQQSESNIINKFFISITNKNYLNLFCEWIPIFLLIKWILKNIIIQFEYK